jgi:hypoxanthine phosphoribosyltransferase
MPLTSDRKFNIFHLAHETEGKAEAVKKELLIARRDIQARVRALAQQISSDYAGGEPVFVGILNGVVFFFADLVREMTLPVKIDFIRAASYGSGMASSGTVQVTKDAEIPLRDQDVIVVEDIVDTGLTVHHILGGLEKKGPRSLRTCALIDKPERREIAVKIDYCGFQVKEGFLVGYGLDHDERYRHFPDIYVLK